MDSLVFLYVFKVLYQANQPYELSMKKIALLIDGHSTPATVFDEVMAFAQARTYRAMKLIDDGGVSKQLQVRGRICECTVFADFAHLSSAWQDVILRHALHQAHHDSYANKKTAYIALTVRAMELVQTDIDEFIIVSTDSDFTPLVKALRQAQKVVVGVGNDDNAFSKACTIYKKIDKFNSHNDNNDNNDNSAKNSSATNDTPTNSLIIKQDSQETIDDESKNSTTTAIQNQEKTQEKRTQEEIKNEIPEKCIEDQKTSAQKVDDKKINGIETNTMTTNIQQGNAQSIGTSTCNSNVINNDVINNNDNNEYIDHSNIHDSLADAIDNKNDKHIVNTNTSTLHNSQDNTDTSSQIALSQGTPTMVQNKESAPSDFDQELNQKICQALREMLYINKQKYIDLPSLGGKLRELGVQYKGKLKDFIAKVSGVQCQWDDELNNYKCNLATALPAYIDEENKQKILAVYHDLAQEYDVGRVLMSKFAEELDKKKLGVRRYGYAKMKDMIDAIDELYWEDGNRAGYERICAYAHKLPEAELKGLQGDDSDTPPQELKTSAQARVLDENQATKNPAIDSQTNDDCATHSGVNEERHEDILLFANAPTNAPTNAPAPLF